MITFKQYLVEDAKTPGNYISIKSDDLGDFFSDNDIEEPVSGESPPKGDYHCTLMYSKGSAVDTKSILKAINEAGFQKDYKCTVTAADCFDADDGGKSCVVLKLDIPEFHKLHKFLKTLGLDHSYPKFAPHVSLRYNMDVEEAHKVRDAINASSAKPTIKLSDIHSETINTNYV